MEPIKVNQNTTAKADVETAGTIAQNQAEPKLFTAAAPSTETAGTIASAAPSAASSVSSSSSGSSGGGFCATA